MDANTIVFATGGYDHSIKFWYPHDGVCYRTAQHAESVSLLINAHPVNPPNMSLCPLLQQVNTLEVTPDKRYVASGG